MASERLLLLKSESQAYLMYLFSVFIFKVPKQADAAVFP